MTKKNSAIFTDNRAVNIDNPRNSNYNVEYSLVLVTIQT